MLKVVDKETFEHLKNERIRLVSKKLVEGINRREQSRLDQIDVELASIKPVREENVEFDYFY